MGISRERRVSLFYVGRIFFIFAVVNSSTYATAKYIIREPASQIAMPNAISYTEKVFMKGESVIDVPLLWKQVALPQTEIKLNIDGKEELIAANTILPMHLIGHEERPTESDVAYCTPRKTVENRTENGALGVLLGGGSIWRNVVKGATDRQLCLLDRGRDGSLDSWVLIGDGSIEARNPNFMPAIRYSSMENVPISKKDRYKIYFHSASGSGKWAGFRLEIIQQGTTRSFDTMTTNTGSYSRIEKRLRPETGWPMVTNIGGADLIISSIEEKGRKLRIFWPENLNTAIELKIPDNYEITYQY